MTANTDNQPDWHAIAEKFDVWLPYLEPAGTAMLKLIQAQPGQRVLDIASGTGEPALTLAERIADVTIIGTDAAAGMVNVAQAKVSKRGLKNIEFVTMPGDHLAFGDASFDALLCRFGIMFFDDPLSGLKEMHRVLKPGGRFAFAVWHTAQTMPVMRWSHQAFKGKLAAELLPPLEIVTRFGAPGVFEKLLHDAGFRDIRVSQETLNYRFDSFDHYWQLVEASDILKMQFDALPPEQRANVKDEVAQFAHEFTRDDGLHVPHDYLLAGGVA